MEKPITIRAHHLLCIPRFYRREYNKRFAEKIRKICNSIRKNPQIPIKLVSEKLDNLCYKCPHAKQGRCNQSKEIEQFVIKQDKKVIEYLKLKANSVHRAKEIFNLSMKKINDKNVRKFCNKCIFVNNCSRVGINKSFKKDLN
ncbi:MAG: DUF1284 domain-containing protein [archaeon]|nr:DUF1284 domain-containing protein [archaeon]